MKKLPPIPALPNAHDEKMQDLEQRKLEAEIVELQKRRKPAYVQAVASVVIALATVIAASKSEWYNNQIKQLQDKKDAAQEQLKDAEEGKRNAQKDLYTLVESTNAQVARIISERQRVNLPKGSSSQEKEKALIEADKAVQQSLAQLQGKVNSISEQTADHNIGPGSSTTPSSSQLDGYKLVSTLSQLTSTLLTLDSEWVTANMNARYELGATSRVPSPPNFPTELPPSLALRLGHKDQDVLKGYAEAFIQIKDARSKAMSFIKMTPGQLAADQQVFELADASARKRHAPSNVADLQTIYGRFGEMNSYIESLRQHLISSLPKVIP